MGNQNGLSSYRKKYVDAYLDEIFARQSQALAEKDAQIQSLNEKNAALLTQYNDLQAKYTALSAEVIELQKDKSRVANVLIGAETTAASIIEQARGDAEKERVQLLAHLEDLREEVIDRNRLISDMKRETLSLCEKMKSLVSASCAEFTARMDEGTALAQRDFTELQANYAVPEDTQNDG